MEIEVDPIATRLAERQRQMVRGTGTIAMCAHLLEMPRVVVPTVPRVTVEGRAEGIPLGLAPLTVDDEGGGAAKKN